MLNDFTKEELEIIRWYLQKEIPTPHESHIDLLLKIQSMIRNYCKHAPDYYQQNNIFCSKCDKDLI